jgi:hypothetical protein
MLNDMFYSSGKKPGEARASDQCVANAICSAATNNTCACNMGYKATPASDPTPCEYTYMKELDAINVSKLSETKRKRSFVSKCLAN